MVTYLITWGGGYSDPCGSQVKPGSRMPRIYLGQHRWQGLEQHCGICEHSSLTHNLPQELTAGLPAKLSWVQLHRQQASRRLSVIVCNENILCEHHLLSQHTPVRRFNPYLKWMKIAQFNLHFEQIWVCWHGQIAERCRFTGRLAGYENQAWGLYSWWVFTLGAFILATKTSTRVMKPQEDWWWVKCKTAALPPKLTHSQILHLHRPPKYNSSTFLPTGFVLKWS